MPAPDRSARCDPTAARSWARTAQWRLATTPPQLTPYPPRLRISMRFRLATGGSIVPVLLLAPFESRAPALWPPTVPATSSPHSRTQSIPRTLPLPAARANWAVRSPRWHLDKQSPPPCYRHSSAVLVFQLPPQSV